MSKPCLIYDGESNLYRRWVADWQQVDNDNIDYCPYQDVADQYPDISHEDFEQSIHLILPDGTVYRGVEAVFHMQQLASGSGWVMVLYRFLPGFAFLSQWIYPRIANHQNMAYRLIQLLWGEVELQSYRVTRWLFLRMLGVIYLIAFLSFATQALGLIGSGGILPIIDALPLVAEQFSDGEQYLRFPTMFWFDASDSAIISLTIAGIIFSALLILRVAPALMLFLCWLLYLSLVIAGQAFMSFQWENLLLETGFLAIFLAPWNIRPSAIDQQEPPRAMIWLIRWLVFRLIFASGMVKLLSGDPNWLNLTALTYHYETQPLPNPISWFMHQLPVWFHQLETLATLVLEILIPFLFFMPRRLRIFGANLTILLQIILLLTGNFTYFNWLTIALCVPLLDDALLARILPKALIQRIEPSVRHISRRRWLTAFIALSIGMLSFVQFGRQIFRIQFPEPITEAVRQIAPLRLANTYGLFAVMTTSRPQIMIEGSNDGEEWQEYGFRFQPQALTQIPPIVAPHQPRLDWQLWFAALGDYRNNRWFIGFVQSLLEGSPDVTALLASNPFPDKPPKYIRALRYDYTFSDWETLNETGQWWQRQLRDTYLPIVSLDQFSS